MTPNNAPGQCRIRGLAEPLPEGERLLWQGAPEWRILAQRALHVRKVALYFALLVAWRLGAALYDGRSLSAAALSALWMVALAAAAIGLLSLIAWLISRSTVYAITDARVIMRFGVAIAITLNLPLRRIEAAALRANRDGSGDIPLQLGADDRVAYVHLWPHARPRHLSHPQPMLRALPDAAAVAQILAGALAATLAQQPATAERPASPAASPRRASPAPRTAALA
jgi:Bacterial PH domain